MNLTINLSESNIAMLETRARAARMPTKDYLSLIVGCVLDRQRSQNAQNLANHLNEMATCLFPDTTPGEMEAALQVALSKIRPRRAWQP